MEPYGIPSSAIHFIIRWRRLTGCWSKAAETSISTPIYHAKRFIMNYIKRLTYFFDKSVADPNFTPTHLSLFMALFQLWNQSRFLPTIQIVRDDVMRLSKINSKATYHKAMGYLHRHRYIDYEPSYNPFKGSKIGFFPTTTITSAEPVQILTARPINEPNIKRDSNPIIHHNRITSSLSIDQKRKRANGTISSSTGQPRHV